MKNKQSWRGRKFKVCKHCQHRAYAHHYGKCSVENCLCVGFEVAAPLNLVSSNWTELRWSRMGSLYHTMLIMPSNKKLAEFEVSAVRGYDKLAGGNTTEWRLEVNGQWQETFQTLRDAKQKAQELVTGFIVAEDHSAMEAK